MSTPDRAACVVLGPAGSLLVVRRARGGRRYCVLPGGGVEPGEDPGGAAVRELGEETGLGGRVLQPLGAIDHPDRRAHYFLVAAEGDLDAVALRPGSPEHARQSADDHHEPAWISLSDLAAENLQPEDVRDLVRHAATPMRPTVLASLLPTLLDVEWGLRRPRVRPSGGPVGMGSFVVEVDHPEVGGTVAKWVPSSAADALDRGSAIALEVEGAGIAAGAPLPTRTGALSAGCLGGRVALLRRVPGRPLTGTDPVEQQRMADVLARVHAVRAAGRRQAPYLADSVRAARDVEPWVRPSVEAVLAEYASLPPLAWGLVHHDPAPEAFFHDDRTGATALIDWTGAGEGPVLYDVASAVMYLGGLRSARTFLDTYTGLVPQERAAEVRMHLPAMLRFRGAVQVAYFSVRVAERDLTGVSSQADNLAGLEDGRRLLVAGGVAQAARGGPARGVLRAKAPEVP